MPFWSDIEPYIDYWLQVNVNRHEESEPYRLDSRRSRRHRSDDPAVSQSLAHSTTKSVEKSVPNSHLLQIEESAATSEEMQSASTASIESGAPMQSSAPMQSATTEDGSHPHTAPARPYRTPKITTSADNHEEIEELKIRYIVGRKAGKDITRPNGKLIVSKGEVITRRMIAEAEEAGKLVELILNMVLEDFDL
ncbi:hypothetical protein [Alicyclobacillus mengziensis]|uniref:Uncharacterized protein n=1 Tax=Alicyclobacillus mengziensis TaxID=2931921 RepID=A0A9X7VYT0_9BACL|nr:hypothetical protein [Alicyclobacillus mengziensis]QSO47559.1 hypothetical protein JZ786_00360 [Alicyclobacillus mengziensis]